MASLLLKGGRVVDGTGKAAFEADVLVRDGKIAAVGRGLSGADREIDVTGLVVAPGFIDTHSHSDLDVLLRPQVLPKIMQGITTELLGQDGVSLAPLPTRFISPWRKNLAGLDGDSDEIDWTFETTDNYLKMIEAAHPGLNEMYLVPHGNIRMEAMGLDNRLPTEDELEAMRRITRREMEAGAMGLSTGLIYIPCAYGESRELIEMCKVVAEYDGVFVIHQRSEADTILDSMREVIEIGRQSGVKVHWSHFKVCGKQNWDKIDAVLALLDEAKAEGITVSFDQYPYVAGSTMMGAILPPWVHDGCAKRWSTTWKTASPAGTTSWTSPGLKTSTSPASRRRRTPTPWACPSWSWPKSAVRTPTRRRLTCFCRRKTPWAWWISTARRSMCGASCVARR